MVSSVHTFKKYKKGNPYGGKSRWSLNAVLLYTVFFVLLLWFWGYFKTSSIGFSKSLSIAHVENAQNLGSQRFPANPSSAHKLLLLTHNRVIWYDVENEELTILAEGEGVYYGGFPGDGLNPDGSPSTVWVVSRPHNWKPQKSEEWLVELDVHTGREIRRRIVRSRFTHDTVRHGNRVYAADCAEGTVVELDFPSMQELRRMELFTAREHVNTLSPTADGRGLWAMLHNLGPSILAYIDLASGTVTRRLPHIGVMSHGAVQWRGFIVSLDSESMGLIRTDPETGVVKTLWKGPPEKSFLKGLTIVDDIAYFGIAEKRPRETRDSVDLNCELAAFDLAEMVFLWRRRLPTRGLLNVIAAPHVQVESTAMAVTLSNSSLTYRATQSYARFLEEAQSSLEEDDDDDDDDDEKVQQQQQQQQQQQGSKQTLEELQPLPEDDPLTRYPAQRDPKPWASGYPRFNLKLKNELGMSAGAQLRLFWYNSSAIFRRLQSFSDEDWEPEGAKKTNAYWQGRESVLHTFKPGTKSMHLIFSDQAGDNVYEFPWYRNQFAELIDPLLEKILGRDTQNIMRVQFALMPPGTIIKNHKDNGGYSTRGHRIHLVVKSSSSVSFNVYSHREEEKTAIPLHTEEGLVFELNNRLTHSVENNGSEPRIHMVVDVADSPRTRVPLAPGQICNYDNGKVTC